MNISSFHSDDKPVQAKKIFDAEGKQVNSIQILAQNQLKEHTTPIPALLVCVIGEVIYEDEKGTKETLLPGDFVNIEPLVKHKLNALKDSNLLLIK